MAEIKFVPIRVEAQTVTVSDFNRMQQAVALAVDKLSKQANESTLAVHLVTGDYTASALDQILLADPNGGPVKVVLPVAFTKQQVTVMNTAGTSGNPVTITRTDGKPFKNGIGAVTIPKLKTSTVVCDGADWFVFVPDVS
jgi:hypothetical protein